MSTPLESRLAPARRPRGHEDGQPLDDDEADLARGQAAAVLAALGRVALRLDVLTRGQQDGVAELLSRLDDVSARLARLEALPAQEQPL